jgi:hypothetical protein
MPGNFKIDEVSKIARLMTIEAPADTLDNYGSQCHNTPCSIMEV